MAIRRPGYERMIVERETTERATRRAERRHWFLVLGVCLLWCVAGGLVTAAGFMLVLEPATARVLIDAGQGIAAAGVLLTVLLAAAHRRDRGY
jgi:nitrate reductase NapE component